MPDIKCDHGHVMTVTTTAWVEQLTLDQLRFARTVIEEKINTVEIQPKRTIWRICRGNVCAFNYLEDQYEKAADHLLRIFKDYFMKEAIEYVKKPYGTETFKRALPSIEIERVTQFEYDNEWFPQSLDLE